MGKKVAVILSGCGYLDGAEIRESVLTLLSLDQAGAEVSIFAPNENQHHTVNHLKGEEEGMPRNILAEAGRIARGKISPIKELKAVDFDALVIPGGFGVAKNLCTFAFEGSAGKINREAESVLKDFNGSSKPIGAICIAPALVALALGDKGVEVTIGTDKETATEVEKTGAKHINCEVDQAHVDSKNKIVSTPAYMFDDAALDKIFVGIKSCVDETLKLA